MTAQDTLDRLSKAQNFATWTFGRLTKALHMAADAERFRLGDDALSRMLDGLADDPTPIGTPWDDEPDKVQWIDRATDMDCLVVRNHMGSWCGYVGVMPDHPWHGVDYDDCPAQCADSGDWCQHRPAALIEVHGGFTFSSFCEPGEPVEGICHRALDGRPDNVWWFGFDCGHAWDYQPGLGRTVLPDQIYRDLEYVVKQVEVEAAQLKAAELEARISTMEIAQAVESITSDTRPKVE